jgi:hypothetical protein
MHNKGFVLFVKNRPFEFVGAVLIKAKFDRPFITLITPDLELNWRFDFQQASNLKIIVCFEVQILP